MFGILTKTDKETAEKILALLGGLSYAKAIDIVDCAHDMLKYHAFVHVDPPPVVPSDFSRNFETMWKEFNAAKTGTASF